LWTEITWKEAKQNPVSLVRTNESAWKRAQFTTGLTSREKSSTDWRIVIMPSYRDAEGRETVPIATTVEEYNANSKTYTILSNMRLLCPDSTTRAFKSTAKTMTEITSGETFDSSRQKSTTAIRKFCALFSGMGAKCLLWNFGKNTAHNIAIAEQLQENSEKVCYQNELLPSKHVAVVPTFDILNAGPRNRYMILTQNGPLIVHNCGFGLGGGEEYETKDGDIVKGGLWGYAWNMGVKLTQEEAHKSVQVFRQAYPEVCEFWWSLEDAAIKSITHPGKEYVHGPIRLQTFGKKVFRMLLPSGRGLHYIRPKIEEVEVHGKMKDGITIEGKDQVTKQWGRTKTYGGRLTENLVQAIARDVLLHAMLLADKIGHYIVLHVHDEIGCEEDKDTPFGLESLKACMTRSPLWAPDLLLGAEGYEAERYRKD
jgi:hypothetical protein